jgi:hypothetical protein
MEAAMGSSFGAICKSCNHKFTVCEGGGFLFHLLHCDKCGKDKGIGFGEIGTPHLRYIKGLPGPYCIATAEQDKYIRENFPGETLSEEEYNDIVEKIAGKCECGGQFKFDAPSRCPKCNSTEYDLDPEADCSDYD